MAELAGRRGEVAWGGLAVLASAALFVPRAWSGWIPHDEGLLAQSAERVLHGELPHRDFDAAYTGGLELLHAAAFRLLGVSLGSLRSVLVAFGLAFVIALFLLARRVVGARLAAAVTVAATAWSLPNYFAALPSWYVLFFWTFGALLLATFAARRRLAWLGAAGACAGLAFLAKTNGVLFLVVAFFFLVYDDQAAAAGEPPRPRSRLLPWALGAVVVLVVAGLVALVSRQLGAMALLVYVVPGAAVGALLVAREVRLGGGPERAWRLVARGLVLGGGAAVPVLLFLVPYALSGSLGDFWRGTFVLPQRRFEHASYPLPPLWTAAAVLPLALPLAFPATFGRLRPWVLGGVTAVVGVGLLAFATAGEAELYRAVWYAVRPLSPVVVTLGCLTLARRPSPELGGAREGFLVLALAALVGLLQFPYAFGIYFCYTAPLLALAAAWTARERGGAPLAPFSHVVLAFFAAFAVLWLNTGWIRRIGVVHVPAPPTRSFALARAGLEVPAGDAGVYEALVAEIDRHAAPGAYIYAAPDCPEVYFLAGRRNPTRTFYDVFDEDAAAPAAREARLLRTLSERDVRVVVLSTVPEFSPRQSPALLLELATRYPTGKRVGPFLVLWRP